ncbi:lantibiotic dehydratase [Algoriphagus jejuensis]
MKFLFRVPLLDLDPNSESEISHEWDRILDAIANSSPTLYEAAKHKDYSDLTQSIKNKVFKYLLRGRYRSTPFGLWSGVGIGRFDDFILNSIDLTLAEQLPENAAFPQNEMDTHPLQLSLGGSERMGRVHFLGYMRKEERWVFVSIPKNPLSSLLLTKIDTDKGILFEEFNTWFEGNSSEVSMELWNQLKELGILSDGEKYAYSKGSSKTYIDSVIKEPLTLPFCIKAELDAFFETAGGLFSQVENRYVNSLTTWFESKFDDRFVPLPLLLDYPDFVFSTFLEPSYTKTDEKIGLCQMLNKVETISIDLKEAIAPKPMDDGIFDLGFVFKKLNTSGIIVENLVCNRPFSFFGRFNRDERIYSYEQELKDKIFRSEEIIYAELRVFETSSVEGICDTKPLFDRYISPYGGIDHKAIALTEIEIGVRSGRFLLFDKRSGKRIIPVVTHPLNGKEISHPLIRLLWELELQDSFKFTPYQSAYSSESNYTPELRWGNFILQSRKWTVQKDNFLSKTLLIPWLDRKGVPSRIKIGIYDRELILDWRKENDFDILWVELVKNGRLTICEALWLDSQAYYSENKRPIYPEFVANVNRPKKEVTWNGFINSISEEDKSSLYILVRIQAEDLWDFLDFYFSKDLVELLAMKKIIWYYIVYPDGERLQVRIRYLRIDMETKKELLWPGYGKLSQEHLDVELRPYYPEIKKYGENGRIISEEVFHLESMLMVGKDFKNNCINQVPEPEVLLGIVVRIWQRLLGDVWDNNQIFRFLRDKVKGIPFHEKKNLTIDNDLIEDDTNALILYENWMDSFHQMMIAQISDASNDREKWLRISNHLHMQVNRFFPLERKKMETWIYLQLYRASGKKMHSG